MAIAVAGALLGERTAAACDDHRLERCSPWRTHGSLGLLAGGLGGDEGGAMGFALEAGANARLVYPRLEYGYGVISGGTAGPGTLHRAALALAVPIAGFGPRMPDRLIQLHLDLGVGAQWQQRLDGDAAGLEATIGGGMLLVGPGASGRRHLLNWLRFRAWLAPQAGPQVACVGACGSAQGPRRRELGVLVTWTIGIGAAR